MPEHYSLPRRALYLFYNDDLLGFAARHTPDNCKSNFLVARQSYL